MRSSETVDEALIRCLTDERYACWSIHELGRMVGGTEMAAAGLAQLRREGWVIRVNDYGLLSMPRVSRER